MVRMRIAVILGLAMAFALPGAAQKQLAGEWQGTLSGPSGDVNLVWHVTAAADGTLTSTFDNPTEGVNGIKVKTLELKDNALTLEINDEVEANGSTITIRGTLTGTLSADGNEISATWKQMEPEEDPPMDVKLKRVDSSGTTKP